MRAVGDDGEVYFEETGDARADNVTGRNRPYAIGCTCEDDIPLFQGHRLRDGLDELWDAGEHVPRAALLPADAVDGEVQLQGVRIGYEGRWKDGGQGRERVIALARRPWPDGGEG